MGEGRRGGGPLPLFSEFFEIWANENSCYKFKLTLLGRFADMGDLERSRGMRLAGLWETA